ncbi:hypothetical protein K474DRAFT_1659817 [Panus rudis PR-1116 ss-1]|nr:hypothetical protein K474DRAFT_1659817 [Panus rudis PR-1116 ss-1]
MSSTRTISFANVVALVALHLLVLSLVSLQTAASPVPIPMPLLFFSRDAQLMNTTNTSYLARRSAFNGSELYPYPVTARRDVNTMVGDINILNSYCTQLTEHANNFRALGQPTEASDSDYQQQSSLEASGVRDNLHGLSGVFGGLAADKGLANYNQAVILETPLKDTVNSIKYFLNDVDEDVYNLPGLGSTLGPIVYEIKCILDELLDALENITDGVLNDLLPLYRGAIVQATQTTCNSGLQIAGLCIAGL